MCLHTYTNIVCIYIYTYVYIYMYVCIHNMHVHVCAVCVCIYIYIFIHVLQDIVSMHMYILPYMHQYIPHGLLKARERHEA